MAFLYGDFLAIPAAVFNLFSSAKRPVFSVSGAWQGSDIPFEMSRTHYFTLQNYHKTTDKQSKIRVFVLLIPRQTLTLQKRLGTGLLCVMILGVLEIL